MSEESNPRGVWYYAATALSLWLGWGIRGNFGHEYGAMMPGALATLAAVLLSGRVDWQRRAADFALFGALGWSFGGSISYMQVVAYTHSGHSASVLYGFACLFVIGFLWAALGGAGTALSAVADRRFLSDLLPPHGRGVLPLVAARGGDRAVAPGTGLRAVLVRHRLGGRDAGHGRRCWSPARSAAGSTGPSG